MEIEEEDIQPIDEVSNATSLLNAKVLGIDNSGGTRLFKISEIKGDYKGIATFETNPGTPALAQWYKAKPGLYPNFLNASGNPIVIPDQVEGKQVLNPELSFDGTSWIAYYEPADIEIDLSKEQGAVTARQNVLTENESTFTGTNAGRWGTTGTPPAFAINSGKLEITFTSDQNQWLGIPGIYKAGKTYVFSLKSRLVSGTTGQITFGVATGGVNENNFKFTPTAVEQSFSGTIKNNTATETLYLGTVIAQNHGQVVSFDDIIVYEDQPLDKLIKSGDELGLIKQDNKLQKVLYSLVANVYKGTSIRSNLALYSLVTPITTDTKFNAINFRAWGSATTKCTIRLYEAFGTESYISEMKLISEWRFETGLFNQIPGDVVSLKLLKEYTVKAGKKLVVFLHTQAGDNVMSYQLVPTDADYASASHYYILNTVPPNPWDKTGVNPLTLTSGSVAKSEAVKLSNEVYARDIQVMKVNPPKVLINNFQDFVLTGWYNNYPYIESVGNGTFASNKALYIAATCINEFDFYGKLRPIETGTGGIEFGIAKRSYGAGTAVSIGHNGTNSFCKIYSVDTDTINEVGSFVLPFLVEIGTTYQIRIGKRDAQMIIEIWKDTGEYWKKDDWYQTSADNPNFGAMWGHPCFFNIRGKVQVQECNFTTPYKTAPKLVVWGDSYTEASTLGVDRSGSYLRRLQARIGHSEVAILGRGGEKSPDLPNRFDYELEWFKSADYAYLAIGVNDSDYTIWLTNMKSMISKVRAKGMIPILATVTANTNGSNFTRMEQQNEWIRNVSGEFYVDVHKAVSAGGSTWKPGTVMEDGIHPTLLGHEYIFNRQLYDLSFLL